MLGTVELGFTPDSSHKAFVLPAQGSKAAEWPPTKSDRTAAFPVRPPAVLDGAQKSTHSHPAGKPPAYMQQHIVVHCRRGLTPEPGLACAKPKCPLLKKSTCDMWQRWQRQRPLTCLLHGPSRMAARLRQNLLHHGTSWRAMAGQVGGSSWMIPLLVLMQWGAIAEAVAYACVGRKPAVPLECFMMCRGSSQPSISSLTLLCISVA